MDSDPQGAFFETAGPEPLKKSRDTPVVPVSHFGGEHSQIQDSSFAGKGVGRFPAAYYAATISLLVAAGSYSILPIWLIMGRLWLSDPLRAIGAVFPLVAFAGVLAAWRRIGWSMNGTYWALPLLAACILMSRLTTSMMLVFHFHVQRQLGLHPGLVMFFYGVGAVLLFGGPRLLRASIAPLCLLLFINPVPHFFNTAVDLPLQFLGATTARHFAHLIGLQPTGEQLRMMFTPNFGMMIVPGCNGVRGSITLAYLALIFGYVRHLRPRTLALTTLGAFLMGYVLNLVRLCVLVIYYRVGVSVTSIQPYGAGVDYAIGGTLFLFATLGVGLFIRWVEPETQGTEESKPPVIANTQTGFATAVRAGCFAVIALAFILPTLGSASATTLSVKPVDEQAVLSSFPAQVGAYRLVRTYTEQNASGLTQFVMGEYSKTPGNAGSSNLTFGLYVGAGAHLVSYSKLSQGIRPSWTGSFEGSDGNAQQPLAVHYVTTLYDDGISQEYDAESACYETG
jgi:exosortase J